MNKNKIYYFCTNPPTYRKSQWSYKASLSIKEGVRIGQLNVIAGTPRAILSPIEH